MVNFGLEGPGHPRAKNHKYRPQTIGPNSFTLAPRAQMKGISQVGQNHQQHQTDIYAIFDQGLRVVYSVFKRPWGQNPSKIMASSDYDKRRSSRLIRPDFKGDIRESERSIPETERLLNIDAYIHYE
ncbi:hypothetical protein O181_130194 [Austropuccinia psidii MF-1]|uniref:Uncharacterized protein n=1 Tax=Austropuccinia psidii MF-1 TaxID=1389203 RepID=A0A9Q3Q9U7_9BASI|nr:hypothetical protein [Austropuccinia psidii MF-1]